MSDERQPVVEIRGVSKRFPGVQALDRVSLDIRPVRCTRSRARTAPASRR